MEIFEDMYTIRTFNKWGAVWETKRGTKKGVADVIENILSTDDCEYFQVEMKKEQRDEEEV